MQKKPANGGMPANENNMISKDNDKIGWFFDKPDKSSMVSKYSSFRLSINRQLKNAKFITK